MGKKQLSLLSVLALAASLTLSACGADEAQPVLTPNASSTELGDGHLPPPTLDPEDIDPTMPPQNNPVYYIFALENERLWLRIDENGGYAIDAEAAGEGLFITVKIEGNKLVEKIAYSDGTFDEVSETITGDYKNLQINGWTRIVGPADSMDAFAEQDCKDMAEALPDAECDLDSLGGKAGMFAGVRADWINAV